MQGEHCGGVGGWGGGVLLGGVLKGCFSISLALAEE